MTQTVVGAVQAKVSDATLAKYMSFLARSVHPCGVPFQAKEHLRNHPEFDWQNEYLKEFDSHPWTRFSNLLEVEAAFS